MSIRRVAPLAFKFRVSGLGFGVTVPVDRTGGTAALRVKRVDAAAHGRGASVHWCIFGVILVYNYKSIITVTAITINATGSGLRYN